MRPIVKDKHVLLINDERKLLQLDLDTWEQTEYRRITGEPDSAYSI